MEFKQKALEVSERASALYIQSSSIEVNPILVAQLSQELENLLHEEPEIEGRRYSRDAFNKLHLEFNYPFQVLEASRTLLNDLRDNQ